MTVDKWWNHVGVAMHMDTDPAVDAKGATVIASGTAGAITLDTGTQLFTPLQSTLFFTGEPNDVTGTTGSNFRISNPSPCDPGSGAFTIEIWGFADSSFMPMSTTRNQFMPYAIAERSNASFNAGCWSLHIAVYRVAGAPDFATVQLQFWCADYSTAAPMLVWPASPAVNSGQFDSWRHYAVTRQGDEWTLWLDGVPVDTRTSTVAVAAPSPGADLRIGNSIFYTDSIGGAGTYGRAFSGNLSWFRYTHGHARYTVDFERAFGSPATLPAARMPDALDTGDYTSGTFTGATGAAGANATGDKRDGEPGPDGHAAPLPAISLPSASAQYDRNNETQTRRIIETAFRRG